MKHWIWAAVTVVLLAAYGTAFTIHIVTVNRARRVRMSQAAPVPAGAEVVNAGIAAGFARTLQVITYRYPDGSVHTWSRNIGSGLGSYTWREVPLGGIEE